MEARVCAGIDFYGKTLRYAEVERYGAQRSDPAAPDSREEDRGGARESGGGYRLLRLGSCDFDFDVAEVLWSADESKNAHLETLGEALSDVYEGTSADALHVAVHPTQVYSFFSPAETGLGETARMERFRREARLLAHAPGEAAGDGATATEDALHVTAQGLSDTTGGGPERYHVLALNSRAHRRFQGLMQGVPLPAFQWTISTKGAASVAAALETHRREAPSGAPASPRRTPIEEAPYTLAVGRYHGHVELALARHGHFHFALYAPRATPQDSAYFAAALLRRLSVPPAAVGRVFVYGFDGRGGERLPDGYDALGRLLGTAPQPLDFRPIVGLDPARLAEDFEAGPYVPCIGAAL